MAKTCFPPVVDSRTRLLILGSLPGDASLKAGEYYAHPQNQFWRLVGAVIGEDLVSRPYAARLEKLLARHIGLWDTIASAERAGSLDLAIRDPRPSELPALIDMLPSLGAIAFNGSTAARIGRRQLAARQTEGPGPKLIDLPSSSPAHTRPIQEKLVHWLILRDFVGDPLSPKPNPPL